jgi:hypothetical protein
LVFLEKKHLTVIKAKKPQSLWFSPEQLLYKLKKNLIIFGGICKPLLFQFILHMCLFRAMPKQMARASIRVYIC